MREKQICGLSLYIMLDRAILPTQAATPSGFTISTEPVTVFDYRNRAEFIATVEKAIARGNPSVPEPPEEEIFRNASGMPGFKNPIGLKYAAVQSWDELERNSIYVTISCYPSGFLVEAFGRAKNGKWSDETPLEVRLLGVGVPVVVDVILEHLKSRHDLSKLAIRSSQRKRAKGA